MFYYQAYLTFLILLLPTFIAAQCSDCDSYEAALKACQTGSVNVTAVGEATDTASIHCMCAAHSNGQTMNACQGCWNSNPSAYINLDIAVLLAWTTTCKADGQFGDDQAVKCWEGQPSDALPCFEKTSGSSGGPTLGGSGLTTSATNVAKSPSATGVPSPTTNAKSGGIMSFEVSELLSIVAIGLGIMCAL